jgi:hypothetical protein
MFEAFFFVYGLVGVWNLSRFTKSHGSDFAQRVALPEGRPPGMAGVKSCPYYQPLVVRSVPYA